MAYNHNEIDAKWQNVWENQKTFKATPDPKRPKFYALDMFPYPSGYGLHVGHLASYTPTDILVRYKIQKGFNVLHPFGYDAFGLPAEQFAIQTGIHPAETTKKAIENFRRQCKTFGFTFDWDREVATCDPKYYKWTQFIFLKLFEKGLAYQKDVPVNWCPALRTVLANEEVVDGKSERGGHPVVRLPMKQWMLKITAYAEKLLEGLDRIDWPERTKEGQRNWIGKSEGAEIDFKIKNTDLNLRIFTTRSDTLFGVTFMVLAPEHPMVQDITTPEHKAQVQRYLADAASKSEIDRKANTQKTGVFSGGYAIHPLTQKPIPIWIADYVLMDYGTGAIMAVPGHDVRDYEFAQTFHLPVIKVIEGGDLPYEGDGVAVNSDFLNGLSKKEAIQKMNTYIENQGLGKKSVQYKLRDWLFSRQRYWGEPFPVVHFPSRGLQAVPLNELPVLLPDVPEYQPSETGEAPLARNTEWVDYKDSQTGEMGKRITDTMPGSAGSSWYFLRYCDPHNENEFCSFDAQNYWMPVDHYIGGAEHTVGHLLYARFWQKVLFDAGLVSHDEPFSKLSHQGMILGPDGEKMSKSRGNVIVPDTVREKYGADAIRVYISFMGPLDKDKPWSDSSIDGVRRFLERVWRLCVNDQLENITTTEAVPQEIEKLLHKTIKKVTQDIETLNFNTAVSAMMILVNELYRLNLRPREVVKTLVQLLSPFAPHVSEELWAHLGEKGLVCQSSWPTFNPDLVQDDVVTVAVQVNGKMRGTLETTPDADEKSVLTQAENMGAVKNALGGKPIIKVIYKPGKIINLIIKS